MNREKVLIALAALFLGVMTIFLTGAVFLFLLFGLIVYLIYKKSSEEDRRFIVTVLVGGLLLRVFLAVAIHAIVYTKGFHCISGDDLLYTLKGWGIACGWNKQPNFWLGSIFAEAAYGLNPLTYIIAVFYKIFGFHPVMSKIISCIIGTSIGWLSYLIALEIFDRNSARIAMLIVVFYPSLVRWSVANLKDPLTIFAFMGCVYILIIAVDRNIALWKYAALLSLAGILYLFPNKFHFMLIVCGIGIVGACKLINALRVGFKRIAIIIMGAISLIMGLFAVYVKPGHLINFICWCEKKQANMAGADYAGYYFYTDKLIRSLNLGYIDIMELMKVAYVNIFYFMLTPFPSQMLASRERLIALPQMLLWYLLLVLSVFGYMKLVFSRPKTAFLIGTILAMSITINAIVEGNIGSALRHRDVFSPFFIIFASGVLSELFFKPDGIANVDKRGRL